MSVSLLSGCLRPGLCLAIIGVSVLLHAAPATGKRDRAASTAESIDAFDAIKAGKIAVRFIPQNEHKANVIVENKTKQPLTIKLPDAFVGVPVLAQAAPADAGQAAGAAGGPGFNIPPETTRKITVPTLCLEHGKRAPNAKMAYEMKPLDAVTTKPEVKHLIARYGKGDVSVKAAQAAAWHLQNDMTWKQLATKEIRHIRGPNEPYFTRAELAQAVKLVDDAGKQAKANGETVQSPSDSASR